MVYLPNGSIWLGVLVVDIEQVVDAVISKRHLEFGVVVECDGWVSGGGRIED